MDSKLYNNVDFDGKQVRIPDNAKISKTKDVEKAVKDSIILKYAEYGIIAYATKSEVEAAKENSGEATVEIKEW